jgi:anti-sigma regulatory factor (Ser/Thr protein kinase)
MAEADRNGNPRDSLPYLVRQRQHGVVINNMPTDAIARGSFAWDERSPAQGRRLLESALALPGAVLADAQLLLTEVLSNAILHGRGAEDGGLEVSVAADRTTLRVSVTDHGSGFTRPSVLRPDPTAASGWGLYLLERLAKRWGVDAAADGGASVWFELALNGSADDEHTRQTAGAHARSSRLRQVRRRRSSLPL